MANETPLTDLVTVQSRFTRSVSLSRDWTRDDALDGYILTPGGRDILGRLASAVRRESPTRAWSLTGPYGSDKSAFGLFASILLGGKGRTGQRSRDLLKHDDPKLWRRLFQGKGSLTDDGLLCPILVSGSREPLESAIATALLGGLRNSIGKPPRPLVRKLEEIVEAPVGRTSALIAAFDEAAAFVAEADAGYQGIVLVIDELGKFLEYAANRPEDGDVFALQSLAEAAARSEKPFLLVTILHQALDRYTAHISLARRQGPADVQNGICMCVLHHKLFDMGAFAITPDFAIVVSDEASGSCGPAELLLDLHGSRLSQPIHPQHSPSLEYVDWHKREVFRGSPRPL